MPICSATRRASYTSSSEQQRPLEAPSTARSGRRRWFQSCMVRPMTVRPWRASSAATVELSTPPLMATAMGALRHRTGNPPQMRDRRGQRLHQRVHLLGRVGAAQRNAQAGARALGGDPHGGQHVRRRHRPARAGRAGGNGEAAQIERDHQRLAIDAVEVHVGGIGRAVPPRAIDAGVPGMRSSTPLPAGRAARPDARHSPSRHSAATSAAAPQARNAGDILRAGAPVALVMAAESDRRQARPLAYVERAHALGGIELVAAQAVEVHAQRFHVHRDLAQGLDAVHVQRHASLAGETGDFGDGLDDAGFVVGVHNRDQHGLGAQRAAQVFGIHRAVRAHGQPRDGHAFALQLLARAQHGGMFDGAGDYVPSRTARRAAPRPAPPCCRPRCRRW